jgi:hypothetical protein
MRPFAHSRRKLLRYFEQDFMFRFHLTPSQKIGIPTRMLAITA